MPPTLKFTTASRVLHAQCQGRPRSGRAAARPGRTRRGGFYRQIHGMVHAPTDYFTLEVPPTCHLLAGSHSQKPSCVAAPPLSGFSLQEPLHHSSLACGKVALHVRPAMGAASCLLGGMSLSNTLLPVFVDVSEREDAHKAMLRAAFYPLAFVALHQLLLFTVRKEYTVHESGGIVVTGASTGIGRHAALALAKKGYVVYAGCRKVHCMHVCSVHTTA